MRTIGTEQGIPGLRKPRQALRRHHERGFGGFDLGPQQLLFERTEQFRQVGRLAREREPGIKMLKPAIPIGNGGGSPAVQPVNPRIFGKGTGQPACRSCRGGEHQGTIAESGGNFASETGASRRSRHGDSVPMVRRPRIN